MSYITGIGIANPAHRFGQATLAEFMLHSMRLNGNGDSRKLRTIFKASGIEYRHSVLADFAQPSGNGFFSSPADAAPSTHARLQVFKRHAADLSVEAVVNLLNQRPGFNRANISHLIVVCCTGMYAPGLDIDLVKQLGLRKTVHRTAINFMGCYAAFNALKIADALCKTDRDATVLVVCTELCSLHFQREPTEDNLIANALFADGSAAVLVESTPANRLNLELETFHSDLSTSGEQDMAWTVGDLGFEMKLSSYVPDIIGADIRLLTDSLLSRISRELPDIQHFALHPGGKRILEAIEQALGITRDQNRHAYAVLQRYGNMSSATVLFVLHELMKGLTAANRGEYILSFAFGPGLTMESMVFQIQTS